MRFVPIGPAILPRDSENLIHFDKDTRAQFWENLELDWGDGFSDACGCYVFAIRAGGGERPWYVGKAERQSFKRECLTDDKIRKFNSVLSTGQKGTPLLYFYARTTQAKGNWSRPTSNRHRDIAHLEKFLIGAALKRNKYLVNVKDTDLLRNMVVPGILNSPRGKPSEITKRMKSLFGF